MMSAYYAVAKGKTVGIFSTWNECQTQVSGFKGAVYKKFPTEAEARAFIQQKGGTGAFIEPPKPIEVVKSFRIEDIPLEIPLEMGNITTASTRTVTKTAGQLANAISQNASPPPMSGAAALARTSPDFPNGSSTFNSPVLRPTSSSLAGRTILAGTSAASKPRKAIMLPIPKGPLDLRRELHETKRDLTLLKESLGLDNVAKAGFAQIDQRLEKVIAYLESGEYKSGISNEASKEDERPRKKRKDPLLVEGMQTERRLDDRGFQVDDNGFVHVYTDGACSDNGKGFLSKAGVGVWWSDDNPYNVSEPVSGNKATNNSAEIQAAIRAIEIAKMNSIQKLWIQTDSMFLINCMTQWIEGWKRKGWKTSSSQDVINKDDLMRLDNLLDEDKSFIIRWGYVTAHKGVYGNEAADRLAKAGAVLYKREKRARTIFQDEDNDND